MKFTIATKQLAAGLKAVMPAVAKRTTLPILSGVLLDVSSEGLTLQSTDLEIGIHRILDGASGVEPGSIVVPAAALAKAVTAMAGHDVELSTDATERPRLSLRSGSRTVSLDGFSTEDWPRVSHEQPHDVVASVPAAALADAFARVAMCASDDEARPALTSVALFVEARSNVMQVVATDSYRLGVISVGIENAAQTNGSFLIPARAAAALAKQMKGRRTSIRIAQCKTPDGGRLSTLRFSFAGTTWTVRQIEAEFPNWRQLLPEPSGASCEFETAELVSALKAICALRRNGNAVRLSLGETCSLVLAERDHGEITETLDGAQFSPDGVGAIEVAFNPGYFADAVRFCGGERVRVHLRDSLKPALFGTPDARYLLMPVRI